VSSTAGDRRWGTGPRARSVSVGGEAADRRPSPRMFAGSDSIGGLLRLAYDRHLYQASEFVIVQGRPGCETDRHALPNLPIYRGNCRRRSDQRVCTAYTMIDGRPLQTTTPMPLMRGEQVGESECDGPTAATSMPSLSTRHPLFGTAWPRPTSVHTS
jgi:hypothetical protein